MHVSRYFAVFILPWVMAGSLYAQKRIYNTSRISDEPPVIDGFFNDNAWNTVQWSGDFRQIQPYENRLPSQETKFKILYDENNLYVAIRCFDSAPDSIEKRMSRRDGFAGDWVEINIDSYHDLRTAFSFTITAAGVKGDEAVTNDGDNWDSSWDPIWYVKTQIDTLGWTAEMRIPLTQLRFGKQEEYVWGLQVNRRYFRKEERSSWQFISPNATGWVHHFGELRGIKNITPQRQKDIIPYVVGRFESYEKQEDNPFADGKDLFGTAGLDGKFGITNDLTLDFTINPDFGQVEADPSEVNLTTFETKFSEKRNFFIEGRNILSFNITPGSGPLANDNLFYSRRIGRPPVNSPDLAEGEYVEIPKNTTILGAFKLTGKTRKGWSVGVMESITQKETAEIDNSGSRREEVVEPLANYFAGRLQKDLNDANTRIGAMFTAVNRNLSTPELRNSMHRAAFSGGIDFNHQWKDKTYYFNASAVYSHILGSEAAIFKTQTSAPHFFQRDDADHLEVDSTRKYLNGFGGSVEYGRSGNSKWPYLFYVTWRSPGLDLNDIGYMRQTDEIQQVFWIGFRQREPFSIFRYLNLNFNQWYGTTFGGQKLYFGGNFNINTQFINYWSLGGGVSRDSKFVSTETLRGGPSLLNDGSTSIWSSMNTDQRKKVVFSFSYSADISDKKTAVNHDFNAGLSLQLFDALRLSAYPAVMIRHDQIAYVDNVNYLDEIRYIRGNIEQTQAYLTLRMNFNITPDFTIQYYGMPFISAGKYSDFKYINDSRADDFSDRYQDYLEDQITYNDSENYYEVDENADDIIDYTFDDPNFNVFDFNSNMVLRWEYRPGSVLYIVWSRNKNKYLSTGNFELWDDISELYSSHPSDVFLIKLSYRFGL